MNELISIIVPVYNTQQYIDRCLNSLINQTYTNIEIIVIDDGSTDASYERCVKTAETDKRVKVYQQQNGGVSIARNHGLSVAQGNYFCFVDSDDYVSSIFVETLLNNLLETHSDLSAVSSVRRGELAVSRDKYKLEVWDNRQILVKYIMESKPLNTVSFKLFSKKCIDGITFEPGLELGEDTLFAFMAIDKCEKMVFQDIPLYYYYQRQGSASHSGFDERILNKEKAFDRIYEMWCKRYPDMQTMFLKMKVMYAVRHIQGSLIDNSDKSQELRKMYQSELQGYHYSDIKEYLSFKEIILIILAKYCLWGLKLYEKIKNG